MTCQIESRNIEEIVSTNILTQTSYWARIKNDQGFIPNGFHITLSSSILNPLLKSTDKVQDDLLIFIKHLNADYCYAYVPYGPELEPIFENQGVFLEELSEVLKSHLPMNCVFIRYDLMWQNQWSIEEEYFDHEGNWLGPPSITTQEFRLNFNTHNWNLRKSITDFLPKNTFFLNLKLSEDELLQKMRYNTRYNIKGAIQKGVRVRTYGIEYLEQWYQLYVETAIRSNMPLQTKDYFKTLFLNQSSCSKDVKVRLLMSDVNGIFLSAMFLMFTHKRAVYLYGASSAQSKHYMASYILQWEAIKIAKNYGCLEYDMFGCAPNLNQSHPLHGVHIYKKGFGGRIFHRMGCWDYPFSDKKYNNIRMLELNMQ